MFKIGKILRMQSIYMIEQRATLTFGNNKHTRRPNEVKCTKKKAGSSLNMKGKIMSKVKSKTFISRTKRTDNKNENRSAKKNSRKRKH